MKGLKIRGQKWLRSFHLFFACLWVGGAMSATLMLPILKAVDGPQLYGINQSINFIDIFIIIPGNSGILLMGLIYSVYTNWGWFKYRWITVKWAIGLYGMIFGIIWLGPWATSLEYISKKEGLKALENMTYLYNEKMIIWWGGFQTATIVFAVFISVLKPWRQKRKT